MTDRQALVHGSTVAELLREERLAELGPGRPNEAARPLLAALRPDTLFAPQRAHDPDMAAGCLAGLWLYHDFLDESHRISQDIDTSSGSFWHGIMHRREPDYANAAYWFRRVGQHPVFDPLRAEASALASDAPPEAAFLSRQTRWNPFAFIDLCEKAAGRGDALEVLCRRVQLREWQLLFDFCYRRALGN